MLVSPSIFAQTEPDSLQSVQMADSAFVMTKSPLGAVLRSAVIPGWGQIYNESYWKAPVVWGFLGYFIYEWIQNNNDYKTYRDLFSGSLDQSSSGNTSYYNLREFYKDQRDLFAVYVGLTYFLTLVDSYVDAHLFDFDVSENRVTHSPQFGLRFYLH